MSVSEHYSTQELMPATMFEHQLTLEWVFTTLSGQPKGHVLSRTVRVRTTTIHVRTLAIVLVFSEAIINIFNCRPMYTIGQSPKT
jgi:hypothetical protein